MSIVCLYVTKDVVNIMGQLVTLRIMCRIIITTCCYANKQYTTMLTIISGDHMILS